MRLLHVILLMLTVSIVNAQNVLPASVQEFLDEYAYTKTLKAQPKNSIHFESRYVPPRMVDGQEMVEAFIAIDNEAVIQVLQGAGVIVNSVFDGFVTAQVPMNSLVSVARLRGVTDIEISKKVELCTDSTRRVTHTNEVLNGTMYGLPQSYDGTGVIVGVIDSGYDYQHRAFMKSDDPSQTRLVRVYSTLDKTGHPALYNGLVKLPGSVFMGNEIYSLTYDNEGTHGTHTASIAAGTHVNGYGGMAPGADIVLCAANDMNGTLSMVEIANCVRYIDAYADSVGKPCVMSLSISTPDGQHDGKDYLSKVITQTMGPGRIFVIAAGNNAGKSLYAHKLASINDPLNLLLLSYTSSTADSTYYHQGHGSDIWMRTQRSNLYYKIHVLDKTTNTIVWESEQYSASQTIDAADLGGYFENDPTVSSTGYVKTTLKTTSDGSRYGMNVLVANVRCKYYETVNGVKKSHYAVGITIYPRKTTPCEIDAWAASKTTTFGTLRGSVKDINGEFKSHFYTGASDSCSIGTYAVADSIISAGGFIARNSYFSYFRNSMVVDNSLTIGDIYASSSYQAEGCGPTGKALPTICAPAVNVVAAGNRYSYFANYHANTVMKTADGCYWGVMTGTSMAAPTVAGIIALWLQANPNLSVAEVKDIIAQTAIKDSFTMGNNAVKFGVNGKINALAGLELVLERMQPSVLMGDVNGDGNIAINDLTILIDYLLGNQNLVINEPAADMDGNGIISIMDVTRLIDFLLSFNN